MSFSCLLEVCSTSAQIPLGVGRLSGLEPNANMKMKTLKSLTNAGCCAHAQATNALCLNYGNIHDSLPEIAEGLNQNVTIRDKALAPCRQRERLEIAFLRNTVLQRVQKTSIELQEEELDFPIAVELVRSMRDFITGLRDQFDRYESTAKELLQSVAETCEAATDGGRWHKRKNPADRSSEPDVEMTATKMCRGCFHCDR